VEGVNGKGVTLWVIPNPLYKEIQEFNKKYGTNCTTYVHLLQESETIEIEQIKADPLEKKIYNLIVNDLQGILKKLAHPDYSFDSRGLIISDEFIVFCNKVLVEVKFDEERWDKKLFRTVIEEYISNQPISGNEYARVWTFGNNWKELQIEFLYKVKKNCKYIQ
jgi:hypothetical protein